MGMHQLKTCMGNPDDAIYNQSLSSFICTLSSINILNLFWQHPFFFKSFLITTFRFFHVIRFDMDPLSNRSVGESNLFSKIFHKVSSNGTFIIKRLVSWSLTERSLRNHVHQHLGYILHLVWKSTNKGMTTVRCMERVFPRYEDIATFCMEIMKGVLEVLCDCVSVGVLQLLEDKVEQCDMAPSSQSRRDKYKGIPRSWIKTVQESKKHRIPCRCPVSSSYTVFWD